MFKIFKEKNYTHQENSAEISLASLLIHAAKIDEKYSEKEKLIIEQTLIKLGVNENNISEIMEKAEADEKNSNQILDYTKEAKNLKDEDKLILIEALWSIIYSDKDVDEYESNLMRRLSGLLYLDNKIVGEIKEKIKNSKS